MQCEHMYLPDESILGSLVAREQLTLIANRLILNNAQITPEEKISTTEWVSMVMFSQWQTSTPYHSTVYVKGFNGQKLHQPSATLACFTEILGGINFYRCRNGCHISCER